jgi:hypothetical protein
MERTLLPQMQLARLDDDSRARLGDLYAGETARLRLLTGQMFPSWSV